jgi:hypothetical protein
VRENRNGAGESDCGDARCKVVNIINVKTKKI